MLTRGKTDERVRWKAESLPPAPLWHGGMAAGTVVIAQLVTCRAFRAAPKHRRAHGDVRRDLRLNEEPGPPGRFLIGFTKHGRDLLGADDANTPTWARRGVRSWTLRGFAAVFNGCHASPFAPTGLADGFGEGVTYAARAAIHPKLKWVPRFASRRIRQRSYTTPGTHRVLNACKRSVKS